MDDPTSPPAPAATPHVALRAALAWLAALRPRVLFLLALALHVWALAIRTAPETRTENLRAGFTLAEKGYLGDPFILPTGPTGHLSPVYPATVAAAYRLTGSEHDARTLLSVLCAVVASLAAAMLVPLARTLRLPNGSGALAALFWAVPLFAMLELGAEHETVFSTAAVVLALVVVARCVTSPALRGREGAMLGAATGIGVHFTPLLLPMMVLATAAGVLARRPRFRPTASFVAGFVVVLAIVVTPYTVRNWRVMGAPFFIRDNFGLELAVSNADNARLTADANLDAGAAMDTHPFVSPQAALRVRAEGEVAYNRRRLREATAWIRTHPTRFVEFVTERAGLLLVPWSRRAHQRLAVALISLGFLLGLVTLWRGGRRIAAAVLGGAVIGYDAIYLLVQHDMRYVYPMLRLQSLVAAAACVAIAVRAVRGDSIAEGETESSIAQQPIAV